MGECAEHGRVLRLGTDVHDDDGSLCLAPAGVRELREVTTAELMTELDRRMDDWPRDMGTVRAFLRGTMLACTDAAAAGNPNMAAVLEARRVGDGS